MSDLNQLQTFIEVARRQSFSGAAKALSLPRSTVSARIKALEQRLQTRLFLRNTRRVVLTPEGQSYWHQCQQALEQLQQAEESLQGEQQLKGKVTLSMPVAFPSANIAKSLLEFSQQSPAIQLFVDVSDVSHDLLQGEVDVAIRGRDPGDRDLVARLIGESPLAYVAAPAWWQQYRTEDVIWLEQQLIFAPGGVKNKTRLGCNSFDLALQWAKDGVGPALLPRTMCVEPLNAQQLIELPFDSDAQLPMYLVYASRHLPKRVRALVDFLIAHRQTLME